MLWSRVFWARRRSSLRMRSSCSACSSMVPQHCAKPPSAACFDGVVVSAVAGLGGGGGGASCTK